MLTAIVGCVLFQAGVRRVGDANAAIFSLLEPLTSIVFGVILLHDAFSLQKGLGCGLILLGLLCTSCADLVKKK
jgi:drug/metabolite transporter (DMT)-like permease